MKVRKLVKPRGFGAHLPQGPIAKEQHLQALRAQHIATQQPQHPDSSVLDDEFSDLLEIIELQLCALSGIEEKEQQAYIC